jgi:hypothetical protein
MLTETTQMFAIPVACTALGAVLYAGWIGPWDARRTLRTSVRTIHRGVHADQERGLLPFSSERVDLFRQILRLVTEDPARWRTRLTQRTAVHSPGTILTGVARVTLDRHARRLEKALAKYRRRVWFTGARIALDVDDLLVDSRIPWALEPDPEISPAVDPAPVIGISVSVAVTETDPDSLGLPAEILLNPVGWAAQSADVRDRAAVR